MTQKAAHIDVRGPWPTYIDGFNCITLHGCRRTITVEEAEAFLRTERLLDEPTYHA